jgi:predicted acetyltransferase
MFAKLVKPTLCMEREYYDFSEEWVRNGEEIIPFSARLLGDSYIEWLENTYKFENIESCPVEFVPAHTYFLIADKKILGAINIRHYLNDYLYNFGGHIGYGIRPSERRKGYASLMLSLALPIAKDLGISKALITCDRCNVASAKTIINNGGVLENEVEENGKLIKRYWIEIINEPYS